MPDPPPDISYLPHRPPADAVAVKINIAMAMTIITNEYFLIVVVMTDLLSL
jgi:hypothetical protein